MRKNRTEAQPVLALMAKAPRARPRRANPDRLGTLEQYLVAATKGPKIDLPVAEIQRKGLITALRSRSRHPLQPNR
jgi:hypothetical protein